MKTVSNKPKRLNKSKKPNKAGKPNKPKYLVLGSVMIAIISILIVYIAMVVLGVVQISSYHLVVSTESANKLYDGEPITADGWEIVEGKLAAGHTAEARMLGTQTEVGVSDNNIALTIFDSEGADD